MKAELRDAKIARAKKLGLARPKRQGNQRLRTRVQFYRGKGPWANPERQARRKLEAEYLEAMGKPLSARQWKRFRREQRRLRAAAAAMS